MSLKGKYIIVTAGPTVEPIDPVRFITNRSTGKMGYAVAAELAARGACVVLVSGPTALDVPAGVQRVDVSSAEDMYRAVMERFADSDGAVMCAAVADYTPAEYSEVKVKKSEGDMVIRLRRTKDIAAAAGQVKDGRILVGFALETNDEMEHAVDKLRRKNLDFIVLNSLRDSGAGFGGDTNKITLIYRDGTVSAFPLESKAHAAVRVVDAMEKWFEKDAGC